MAFERFEIEFKKDGSIHDEGAVAPLLNGLKNTSDLIVLAHGWNNDLADARHLYDNFEKSMDTVLGAGPAVAGRQLAILRVYWPSKKFTDSDLIPGGGAASALAENDAALLRTLEDLKNDPERLGQEGEDPARVAAVDRAIALIDQLDASEQARREFVLLMRTLVNPDEAHQEDGSVEFFQLDPEEMFDRFGSEVPVQLQVGEGGAATLDEGGAVFLGDLLGGIKAGARRIANYTTYYQMKARAGLVGRQGLGTTLVRVRDRFPKLRIHLVGHSFGGRVVTAAASVLPAHSADVTLTLLQAAFSHNGFAEKFDGKKNGAFRTVLTDKRISGPIIITHTKNDKAVGVAYPLASRIARDVASALGDKDDPYGGIGRNGAQHTPEVATEETSLRQFQAGTSYSFKRGKIYNLNSDKFIRDHSDVTGREVLNAFSAALRPS